MRYDAQADEKLLAERMMAESSLISVAHKAGEGITENETGDKKSGTGQ